MRTLAISELSFVSGAMLDEVLVENSRLGPTFFNFHFELPIPWDIPWEIPWDFVDGGSGGGGGEGERGLGDTIIGYPVDHHSSKDSLDYGPEWQKILKEMSALERTAFASALSSHAKTDGASGEDGVKEFLNQLAHAVLSNAPGWARDASSRATQNLTQGELGMFEVFVTAAYASAASLPGGI